LGDGAYEQFLAYRDGEGIFGQFGFQVGWRALQRVAESLDQAADMPLPVNHLGYEALLYRGGKNVETVARGFKILAFQDTEPDSRRSLDEGDQGMVFKFFLAVMQPGVLEVESSACRAAHEQAGKSSGIIQRFHEEGFGGRQAVKQNIGEGVAKIDFHLYFQV